MTPQHLPKLNGIAKSAGQAKYPSLWDGFAHAWNLGHYPQRNGVYQLRDLVGDCLFGVGMQIGVTANLPHGYTYLGGNRFPFKSESGKGLSPTATRGVTFYQRYKIDALTAASSLAMWRYNSSGSGYAEMKHADPNSVLIPHANTQYAPESATFAIPNSIDDGKWHSLSAWQPPVQYYNSRNIECFWDGDRLSQTSAYEGVSFLNPLTDVMWWGSYWNSAACSVTLGQLMFWHRKLDATEHQLVSRDPMSPFRLRTSVSVSVPSAPPAGGYGDIFNSTIFGGSVIA